MASFVPENWSCSSINMDMMIHEFPGADMSNALLMSLLEETQGDQEHDEERLTSLIRALEVELEPTTSEDREISGDNPRQFGSITKQEDFQMFDYVTGGDLPEGSNVAPGSSWVDMEIGFSSSQGSTDEPDVHWYMDSCLDEIDYCKKPSTFEEHGYQNLWQENMY